MALPSPLPTPPPPLPARSRNSGCSHMQVTRLYDQYGAHTCSYCGKHPSLGWLYRCTQDSNGFLPESDFMDIDDTRAVKRKNMDHSLHNLSPSIVRAIGRGEYTDEQIQMLVEQKEKVRLTILGHGTRPNTASSSSAGSSSFSDLPESTTFSSNTSATTLDEQLAAAYDWQELQKAWLSEPVHPAGQRSAIEIERENALQSIPPPDIPSCSFKTCATCRPTYRERAFDSIGEVLKNPVLPPKWELENRRPSDARIVARLGLPRPRRFYLDSSRYAIDSSSSRGRQYEDEDYSNEHSFRRRSGFRETVKNALKRASREYLMSLDDYGDNTTKGNATGDSPSSLSRSMLFFRRKARPIPDFVDRRVSVVGNDSLNDSLMLLLASNTPLPPGPPTPKITNGNSNEINPLETKRSTDDGITAQK